MATATDESKIVETWETTTEGTTYVSILDAREGRYTKRRVGGKQGGSRRLHISRDDRRFNQEQVVDEMREYDPFRNGQLVLVSQDQAEDIDGTYHLTTEDLRALLGLKDAEVFQGEVGDLKSELVLRRLKELAETEATMSQLQFIDELIRGRYQVGGTQRTVREMMAAGEVAGGEVLSHR